MGKKIFKDDELQLMVGNPSGGVDLSVASALKEVGAPINMSPDANTPPTLNERYDWTFKPLPDGSGCVVAWRKKRAEGFADGHQIS